MGPIGTALSREAAFFTHWDTFRGFPPGRGRVPSGSLRGWHRPTDGSGRGGRRRRQRQFEG
jgi:hypothetical protein